MSQVFVLPLSFDHSQLTPDQVELLALWYRFDDVYKLAEYYDCSANHIWQQLSAIGEFVPDGSEWLWRERPQSTITPMERAQWSAKQPPRRVLHITRLMDWYRAHQRTQYINE